MDSSPRFRFRDGGLEDSTESDSSSEEVSSNSDDGVDESKLESMTGKGIKRLCSELLELKKASDDEFHTSVYANHSAFVRIFEEVGDLQNELMEMKQHVFTQRNLVQDLMNGIYLEVLSTRSIKSIIEGDLNPDPGSSSELEAHTSAITETLDVLLMEHRLDEALLILEMESATLQKIDSLEDPSLQILTSHKSAMLDMRRRLSGQFALLAEHPGIPAAELQKALSGLCRLGENHRAINLLLQYYHSHIAHGINDLQQSKPFLQGTYSRELAKLVFSLIFKASRSFVALCGETFPCASELVQWAREETKVFVHYFETYVQSLSETTDEFFDAVEAVQHAISYCSLLESQRILLLPYLIMLLQPCMEGVLEMHIDRSKKVIAIFASIDTWELGKFLISGLQRDKASLSGHGEKLEYCQLTNSGRKLVTLMQAIVEDISPLLVLEMKNSILKGLADLFMEYVGILERSIVSVGNDVGRSTVNSTKTLFKQLSILANLSALVTHFLPSIARSISTATGHSDDILLRESLGSSQDKELDSWIFSIQEAADQLKHYFCQQFVFRVVSPGEGGQKLRFETYVDGLSEPVLLQDAMPSEAFQVLYLQLTQLQKLAKDIFHGVDSVVKELLTEVMEAVFDWLSNNEKFWTAIEESSITQLSVGFVQFCLDIQFLVEIARLGGYISDNLVESLFTVMARMESAILEAGLDQNSLIPDDKWATSAAQASICKLQETGKVKESSPREGSPMGIPEEEYYEEKHLSDANNPLICTLQETEKMKEASPHEEGSPMRTLDEEYCKEKPSPREERSSMDILEGEYYEEKPSPCEEGPPMCNLEEEYTEEKYLSDENSSSICKLQEREIMKEASPHEKVSPMGILEEVYCEEHPSPPEGSPMGIRKDEEYYEENPSSRHEGSPVGILEEEYYEGKHLSDVNYSSFGNLQETEHMKEASPHEEGSPMGSREEEYYEEKPSPHEEESSMGILEEEYYEENSSSPEEGSLTGILEEEHNEGKYLSDIYKSLAKEDISSLGMEAEESIDKEDEQAAIIMPEGNSNSDGKGETSCFGNSVSESTNATAAINLSHNEINAIAALESFTGVAEEENFEERERVTDACAHNLDLLLGKNLREMEETESENVELFMLAILEEDCDKQEEASSTVVEASEGAILGKDCDKKQGVSEL